MPRPRKLTDFEAVEELQRQAVERTLKLERAQCIAAINAHDAAVGPVLQLLTGLKLLGKPTSPSALPASALSTRAAERKENLAKNRNDRKRKLLEEDLVGAVAIGKKKVPELKALLGQAHAVVFSEANLRVHYRPSATFDTHSELLKLLEWATGEGGGVALVDELDERWLCAAHS